MFYDGYRLNGYNATYDKTRFDIRIGRNGEKNRVLEITDINSGMTFIVEADMEIRFNRRRPQTGTWRSEK